MTKLTGGRLFFDSNGHFYAYVSWWKVIFVGIVKFLLQNVVIKQIVLKLNESWMSKVD